MLDLSRLHNKSKVQPVLVRMGEDTLQQQTLQAAASWHLLVISFILLKSLLGHSQRQREDSHQDTSHRVRGETRGSGGYEEPDGNDTPFPSYLGGQNQSHSFTGPEKARRCKPVTRPLFL